MALAGGCFNVADVNTNELGFDFVNSPVRYQVIHAKNLPGEMLPSEKTYSFETCLKDRITLSTMALNEFQIDGSTVISDEEGCVVWEKTVDFHPYAQSKSMTDKFVITSNAKYPGELEIPYSINPWNGDRPTATAEFVEHFQRSIAGAAASGAQTTPSPTSPVIQSLSGDKRPEEAIKGFAKLKIQTVVKQMFSHNELSLSDRVHMEFVFSPILQVFDVNGSSHNIVPSKGKIHINMDILTLNKDVPITAENLKGSKKLRSLKLGDLDIEYGKIKVKENIEAFRVLADENIILKLSASSPTKWGSDGLQSPESYFFVRSSEESEVLQEANLDGSDSNSDDKAEKNVDIVSAHGDQHSFFFAEDPKISHIEDESRTTTTITYGLLFSTKLVHKNTQTKVKNLDLYVTHNSKTQKVHVGPDGNINYSFSFVYDIYNMPARPQHLSFTISNVDGTMSVDVPLFLKPWQPSSHMSINPENLPAAKVAHLKEHQWSAPEVYIEKLTLDTATPVEYKAAKDLSLTIRHSYNMEAVVKVRSEGSQAYGGRRIMPAPTGHYKLDAYLTCPKEGLVNRNLYNVDVTPSLKTVTVTRAQSEDELKNLCPASVTSFDIEVESGRATGTFQVVIPDPRMTWSRAQLTLVLRPYETKALKGPLAKSQKLKLSQNFKPAPVARVIVLEDFASRAKTIALQTLPSASEEVPKSLFSLESVKNATKKWGVIYPYIAHLNSLESDYLTRMMSSYVSLDGTGYSALSFDSDDLIHPPKTHKPIGSTTELAQDPGALTRECDVKKGECLKETSKRRWMNYQEFQKSLANQDQLPMDITVDEMRAILWNQPDNRLDDLIVMTCHLWEALFIKRYEELLRQDSNYNDPTLSSSQGLYITPIMVARSHFGEFGRECVREYKIHPFSYSTHISPITATHHLKGPVVAVKAEDAGVDVLHFSQKHGSAVRNNVSFYNSAHADLLGSFFKLFGNLGAFAGASGYSFSMMGEYEITARDDLAGGMTHYSHWTTVKMGLQFAQPKYCLTLRLDPFYTHQFFLQARDHLANTHFPSYAANYFLDIYPDIVRFVDYFENDLVTSSYLICTEEQPPKLSDKTLAAVSKHPVHKDTTAIGMEYYRFASPRFESGAVYDPTKEHFRDWVYPLRGQSDYLKFIHSTTVLRKNEMASINGFGDTFDWSSKYVTWFINDPRILDVNKHLFSSSHEFIKFPKRYIYSRFSVVPPAIGGFYNY